MCWSENSYFMTENKTDFGGCNVCILADKTVQNLLQR